MIRLILLVALSILFFACSDKPKKELVVYVSEDQVFSEPILKDFEKKTGIHVRALYDTEESKSTGVLNKLIAEKENPQADVYWANEPIRAELLRQRGILAKYHSKNAEGIEGTFKDSEGYWCGFSARARVFIVQKSLQDTPVKIEDYLLKKYHAKTVIANPLFGSTTAQIAALYTVWGEKKAQKFMNGLKTNGVKLATSNGESADFVAEGRYLFSLVDSDDAISRIRAKEQVKILYPNQAKEDIGCFIIPNVVMLIKGAKHSKSAKKLIDYLLSPQVEERLAKADCGQIPLHKGLKHLGDVPDIASLHVMHVEYKKVAQKMQEIEPFLKEWSQK